jgi:hypothetical protein
MKKLIITILYVLFILFAGASHGQSYLIPAQKDGLWGFIDKNEHWIIRERFDHAFPYSQGLACVQYYDKWGYIDQKGQWVIQPKFDKAKPFSEGRACVKKGDFWGFIDKSGLIAVTPAFYAVSSFSEGFAVVYNGDSFHYIDKAGNKDIDKEFDIAKPFTDGLASVVYKGERGYIDFNGNWIIKHNFSKADAFSEGLALVKRGDKYGFINHRGDLVIPLTFSDANHFSDGLASVKKNNSWGYIDRRGIEVKNAEFEYAGEFINNLAVVRKNGRYGIINKNGDWIINPVYQDLSNVSNTVSIEEELRKLIELKIRQWELKGEFEKSEDYYLRVTEENRKAEVRRQTSLAVNEIAGKYVKLNEAELGLYNADAEIFTLFVPGAITTLIPVPINDAIWFKDNWNYVEIMDPEFSIYDDKFVVTRFTASLFGSLYNYDAYQHGVYVSTFNGKPELGNLNITLPELEIPVMKEFPTPVASSEVLSEVDDLIPVNNIIQENVFALVIGNENYSSYQLGNESSINVEFAEHDARIFSEYLVKTFGIPRENISLLIDATAGQINQALSKMSALAKAYEGKAEFVFYYAGHGLPDEQSKVPYIIPVDVSPSDLDFAISLEEIYNSYTAYETKRVSIFLDACFSGGARSESLLASRGIRIRPKSPFVMGNLIVFSASRGDQTAFAYKEKKHGMFTYHMLKKIQEAGGMVSYGELARYLEFEVNKRSLLINNREQEPTIKVSPILEYTWRDFSFLNSDKVLFTELPEEY